jgi:hypothetical protein
MFQHCFVAQCSFWAQSNQGSVANPLPLLPLVIRKNTGIQEDRKTGRQEYDRIYCERLKSRLKTKMAEPSVHMPFLHHCRQRSAQTAQTVINRKCLRPCPTIAPSHCRRGLGLWDSGTLGGWSALRRPNHWSVGSWDVCFENLLPAKTRMSTDRKDQA